MSNLKDNIYRLYDGEEIINPSVQEKDLPSNVFPYSHFRLRQFSEEVKRSLPKELWENPPEADRNEKIRKALNKQRPVSEMIKWNKAAEKQSKSSKKDNKGV